MTDTKTLHALKSNLFLMPGVNVYAVLDGASIPDLPGNLSKFAPEYVCLYRGELAPDMVHVAPYLVRIGRDTPFTEWLLTNGWGNHWGIFAISPVDLNTLRRHFRTFLMVYDESGKSLYFRYYDPRVLRVYLPTCNAKELKTVFGPVVSFLVENEEPKVGRKFVFVQNALQEDKVMLG
jgi:hypothetical protein